MARFAQWRAGGKFSLRRVPSEFAPVGRQSPSGPWHSSLGYTSPLLYEHFRDKQEILTELAIEGQVSLA